MKIAQYGYFYIESETVTARQIGDFLGMPPDEVTPRGSRSAQPSVPVKHSWKIIVREPLRYDEILSRLIGRLDPIKDRLKQLLSDSKSCFCGIMLVRIHDHDAGIEETLSDPSDRLQKLPGQHQLLGWDIGPEQLAFLVEIGAALSADEYG